MRSRLAVAWLVFSLLLLLFSPEPVRARESLPPEPAPVGGDAVAAERPEAADGPGTWYAGATPPNADPAGPVLLFVHGKGSSGQTWWGETTYHGPNDMYAYAYAQGYRTAFVDLVPEATMWENGEMLSELLDQIQSHFGGAPLVVVAHSKGGVDTNAALVHAGASGKVRAVVTLGTPHWGTPVADLAFSFWAGWLAELLGQRTDAAYVMQTGYMEYFRSVTDGRDATPFYTLSGHHCGPFLTALWLGCAAIGGQDDGLVPVWSARIPGGLHLEEGPWDHDEIKMGSRTWDVFAPAVAEQAEGGQFDADRSREDGDRPTGAGMFPGNLILRGGAIPEEGARTAFPVESDVKALTLTLLTAGPQVTATVTGPDGTAHPVEVKEQLAADAIFGGAWTGTLAVEAPAEGEWTVELTAADGSAYLLTAELESDLTAALDAEQGPAVPGRSRPLAVKLAGSRRPSESRAEALVALAGERPADRVPLAPRNGGLEARVPVPGTTGVYNATVTVLGTLPDGTAFERTLVTSFAAVPTGRRGQWRGR